MSAETATAEAITIPADTDRDRAGADGVAEDTEFLYEGEPQEPNFTQIAQVLSNVKNERIAFRPDLHAELKVAKEQVSDHGGYRTLTKALKIPRTALVEAGGVGLLRVVTEGRYFTPATDEDQRSRLSLILPVWDGPGGDLIDLLAVRTDQPGGFLVRTGCARCLGAWNIAEVLDRTTLWPLPGEIHPSLVLASNPLQWLRGDCAGVCILHEAWLSHSLAGIRAVTAHNERHAAALHKLLTWPGAPEIFFHQKKKHEAA